jgi:predicted phage terminase large subunit-like protein
MANVAARVGAVSDEERAQIQLARSYADMYAKIVHNVQPQYHHLPWYDVLQDVTDNDWDTRYVPIEERCIVIVAPPGSGKSTIISQLFPSYYLGRHPDHHLIFLTADDTAAVRFNTTTKGILEGNDKHELVFPDQLARPNPSRGWSSDGLYLRGSPELEKDPALLSRGWNANINGQRAHGIIMDDPLDQADSESSQVQETAKAYLTGTVIPRMFDRPNGWIILVTTRWHENDLGGYCSAPKEKGGLGWRVVHLRALDKFAWSPRDPVTGEALESSCWEAKYKTEALQSLRAGDPVKFATVYQGEPTRVGANIFKREWFKPYPLDWKLKGEDGKTHLERCTIVQFWDLAFGDKTYNDFTACVTLAYDGVRFFILHVLQLKVRLLVEAEDDNTRGLGGLLSRHILRMKPDVIAVEAGAFNNSATVRRLVFRVRQLLKDEQLATAVNLVKADIDKIRRAGLPAQEAQAGFMHIDDAADWYIGFINECVAFPNATNDDQVDALSGAIQAAIEAGANGEGRGKQGYALRQPEQIPTASKWAWADELNAQWADEVKELALAIGNGRFK